MSKERGFIILPYRGAPSTVAAIRDGVLRSQHEIALRTLAEQICQDLRSKDYLSEALAYYHFVDAHCRYMRDPRTVEFVRAPYIIAEQLLKGGRPQLDCDDLSALIAGLVAISGGRCRAATLAFQNMFYRGERQFSHVLAQAQEPRTGAWISLDPVAGPRTNRMFQRAVSVKFWPIA